MYKEVELSVEGVVRSYLIFPGGAYENDTTAWLRTDVVRCRLSASSLCTQRWRPVWSEQKWSPCQTVLLHSDNGWPGCIS